MVDRYLWRRGRLVLLAGIACLALQGEFPPSVWDGIYTERQAARGEADYRLYCASCHGSKLEGTDRAPSLIGSDFAEYWDLTAVGDLVDEIQISMPANRPGRLSEEINAAILAYILKANKFPAGSKELPPGADAVRGVVVAMRRFNQLGARNTSVASLAHSVPKASSTFPKGPAPTP